MSHGKGLEDRVIPLGIQTCLSKTGVGYGDGFVHLPMYPIKIGTDLRALRSLRFSAGFGT